MFTRLNALFSAMAGLGPAILRSDPNGLVSAMADEPGGEAVRPTPRPAACAAYGPSEFYSPAQIQAGVGKLGLDSRFIAIGYAGFLPQDDYARAISDAPSRIEYAEAREMFERFQPADLFSASANPEASNFVHYGAGHDGST
jgi:hypothetical protein